MESGFPSANGRSMAHPIPPLPLSTSRLVLRPPTPRDAAVIHKAIEESFDALHQWMAWAATMQSLDETRDFLVGAEKRFLEGEDFAVCAFLQESGVFVLSSGLHPRNWSVPKFEIGYWCRTSMQGRGYTSEAVRALTGLAFDAMGASRVEIRCDSRNQRSRRVAELAGYRLEAELCSDDRANDGSLRDTVVYVLLPGEFENRGAAFHAA